MTDDDLAERIAIKLAYSPTTYPDTQHGQQKAHDDACHEISEAKRKQLGSHGYQQGRLIS